MSIKIQGFLFQQDFETRAERDSFYCLVKETHSHVSRGTEQVDNKISWWVVYGAQKPVKTITVQIEPLETIEAVSSAIAGIGTSIEQEGGESYGILETQEAEELPREEALPEARLGELGSLLAES